jgi:hypothetical protein
MCLSTHITSLPAWRETHRAEKNDRYFDFEQLAVAGEGKIIPRLSVGVSNLENEDMTKVYRAIMTSALSQAGNLCVGKQWSSMRKS